VKNSLFQPSRAGKISRLWWWQIQLPSWPKLRRIPLHVTDKRVAEHKREQMLREFEMEAAGIPGYGSVRRAAAKPLSEHLEAFLDDVKGMGRRPRTVVDYRKSIRKLCERCRWVALGDVTPDSFAAWRASSGLAPKTLNDQLGAMRVFLNWMVRNRLLLANPLEHVGKVSGAGSLEYRRALSVSEARALLAVAPRARASIYLLAMYTGLRRCELNRIRWCDFDYVTNPVRLTLAAVHTKGGRKPAVFYLRPEIADLLKSIHLDARTFGHLDSLAFSGAVPSVRTLKRDLEAAGIPFLDELGRRVDLHSLRKTFVTSLSASGVHPRDAMQLARHSHIGLTMGVYTDSEKLGLVEAVALMPSMSWVESDSQGDAQRRAQKGVVRRLEGSRAVATGHLVDSGEPVASVAVMPENSQPDAGCLSRKMVGAARFELATSTSRT
jgi:integrase